MQEPRPHPAGEPSFRRAERHRGTHPDDRRLFSRVALPVLRVAAEELQWLLERGYGQRAALDLVGAHHQLESRQRQALLRTVCSDAVKAARAERLAPLASLAGQPVFVDAFNLVVTLEVALSGGVLLRGRDQALRDLAGLRRNYHPVQETNPAIALLASVLRRARVAETHVLIDSPMSNSGRLRERFHAMTRRFGGRVTVELVPDADRVLAGRAYVASSDSGVIDRAKSWVNLASVAVAQGAPSAWIVAFA